MGRSIRILLLVCSLASGAAGLALLTGRLPWSPALTGDGRLRNLPVPFGQQVEFVHASMDEDLVILGVGGLVPRLLALDRDLDRQALRSGYASCGGLSSTGSRLLISAWDEYRVVDGPSLDPRSEIDLGSVSPTTVAILGCVDADGWIVVERRGDLERNVHLVDGDPLQARSGWGTRMPRCTAAALDAQTGLLAVLGGQWDDEGSHDLEIHDPIRMRSVRVTSLDDDRPRASVAAAGGRAWFATRSGGIHSLDLRTGERGPDLEMGEATAVRLSASATGHHLAVVGQSRLSSSEYRTRLRVYGLEGGTPVIVAEARAALPGAVRDLALLERSRRVLLAGAETFVWEY